jgi:hypothetical protein
MNIKRMSRISELMQIHHHNRFSEDGLREFVNLKTRLMILPAQNTNKLTLELGAIPVACVNLNQPKNP